MKFDKGHPPSADLRYGQEDSISPCTLIFFCHQGLIWDIYSFYPPDVPKNVTLRVSVNESARTGFVHLV